MHLRFTKMHGAGNDFIVVDATRQPIDLAPAQWRTLADRRFGIGADQVLIVGPPRDPVNDFSYRIVNADGGEVEHCGNGARAFLRFAIDKGLTRKRSVRVEIQRGVITLAMRDDGLVSVAMGVPSFEPGDLPFDAHALALTREGAANIYRLPLAQGEVDIAIASMGNPHAVLLVDDVDCAPVEQQGPQIERHPRFARCVNAGFMQRVDRRHVRLRVWERGTGETLACGTGACAAVATGIVRGLLDSPVRVDARGGRLEIAWHGPGTDVTMTGPAVAVFEGEIEI